MHRDHVLTALWAGTLGSTLAAGSVLCMVTGFSLPLGSLSRLMALWAATAFCCGILFQLKRGKSLYLLLIAFFCGYLWQLGTPLRQGLHLLGRIGEIYNQAYGWGIPIPSGGAEPFDGPLMILGFMSASAVSFWVCRGRGFFPALAAVLLPLASCFVVTDTVPASLCLLVTMAGLGLLTLTASVRQKSIPQANRLTAAAFLPILGVLTALFLLIPRSGYINHAEHIRQQLLQWAQTVPSRLEQAVATLSPKPADRVSLDALGPQSPSSQHVLTVTTPTSGALYLRGRDYTRYTGTAWTGEPSRTEIFTASAESHSAVTIETEDVLDHCYLPYYPSQGIALLDGMAPNLEKATQYTIRAGSLSEDPQSVDIPDEIYLILPENTDYSPLLDTILPSGNASVGAKAAAIADFVRSHAVYDLNTGKMPRDGGDFVLWFLEESQRGYCIHFATAAAVLLRAAGIPSRYVTGFLAQTQAGKPTAVTQKEAHAWAEFFDPQLGAWLILEATPADTGSSPTAPEETMPSYESVFPAPEATRTEPAVTPSQAPSAPQQSGDDASLSVLTGLVVLILVLMGQRRVRLVLRHGRQTRGAVNSQALARWQEAVFLSRLLKQTPEGALLELAQKAKFSRHDLGPRELECFDAYLRFCRQQLSLKPWHIRLIHKYLYAAY